LFILPHLANTSALASKAERQKSQIFTQMLSQKTQKEYWIYYCSQLSHLSFIEQDCVQCTS